MLRPARQPGMNECVVITTVASYTLPSVTSAAVVAFQVENPALVTHARTSRNEREWHGRGSKDESWVPTFCWEHTDTAVAVKILWTPGERNILPLPSPHSPATE